ncbi:MAG: oligoendopeptidase F, partial [Rhodospirillales bacterium]
MAADERVTWNLSDLYAAPDDPQVARDLEWAGEAAKAFRAEFAGKLAELPGERLAAAIARYEMIIERLHRLLSYAQLRFSADMAEAERGRFLQDMQERCNDISTDTLFFCLELNKLDAATIDAQLADPAAQRWTPWVRDSRMYRPHQLDDEMERLLHDKSVTGAGAWRRLFDQTISDLRFDVGGERLSLADTLNCFDNPQVEVRKTAAKALGIGLRANVSIFSLITNTLAKDKEVEDRWRHYAQPISFRNLSNRVEDEVVHAMVGTIRGAYGHLSHRYYRLKAGWLGQTHLDYWDRNAPLPGDDNRRYEWGEARDMVLGAFGRFEPEMARVAQRFFDHGWIDA